MDLTSLNTRFDRLRASDTYKFFTGNMVSGGVSINAWDPASGKRFHLKGWRIVAVVSTAVDCASPFVLKFVDGSHSMAPVLAFESDPPINVSYTDEANLGDGLLSSAADNVLKLQSSADFISGNLYINGVVWGEER